MSHSAMSSAASAPVTAPSGPELDVSVQQPVVEHGVVERVGADQRGAKSRTTPEASAHRPSSARLRHGRRSRPSVVTRTKAERRPGGSFGSQLTWNASMDLMVVGDATRKIPVQLKAAKRASAGAGSRSEQ